MVGEFPELQGLMGRYYAERIHHLKPEIARAIELHYKPKGPTDTVPREDQGDAVACAVALADKLDTLVGFWAIGEKPTGSGDPYQLRRAALGVIRIVLENDFRLPLCKQIRVSEAMVRWHMSLAQQSRISKQFEQAGKTLPRPKTSEGARTLSKEELSSITSSFLTDAIKKAS